MTRTIHRSVTEPIREELSWDERWRGPDDGLIMCWEIGRQLRKKNPELAERAERGELPPLDWKGGVEKKLKKTQKFGTPSYLAQWQGLRGEDLDISLSKEVELTCSATGMKVVFTSDSYKYAPEEGASA